MEYLFCFQYIADIKQIQSDANLAIYLSHGRAFHGEKITAEVLHNPNAVKQLVRAEQEYKFLKNVFSSPAYWQNELYNVLAMLHMLGIPTWFWTLSAANLYWLKIIHAIAVQIRETFSHENILKMCIAERSRYLCQNPVTCVHMFQHHVDRIFTQCLLSKTQPQGTVIDYVNKIVSNERNTTCILLTVG